MQIDFSIISECLANTHGDKECVVNVERERRYTFKAFHLLTNRIANMMMQKLQLRRGDVALCILNNDNLSLLSPYTACKGEATVAYTNATDPLPVQDHQLALTKPKVIFIERALLPTHYELLKKHGVTIVALDAPGRKYPEVLNFWTLMKGVSAENPHVLLDNQKHCVMLRFTGGTTGLGKAVMYSLDNWFAARDHHYASPDHIPTGAARVLHFGMISHASGMLMWPVLFKGGCNITMNDRALSTWLKTVEREQVTASVMVPSMLYRLLVDAEVPQHDLSSLQTIYYGGSPVSAALLIELREKFGDIFFQLYASSEHPALTAGLSKPDHLPLSGGNTDHLSSAGRVTPGVEVLIVDPHGNPLPHGQDGEVWIRSRSICMGYWKDPKKTAADFYHGFWKSGDYGRIDKNGYLYVLDRMKDTVICKGKNVYPSKVEEVVNTHPKVLMSAMVGIPDKLCGEAIHTEVVLREGESMNAKELRSYLGKTLPKHQLPHTIHFAKSLPLSPVGKVLRREVRDACLKSAGTPD